MKKIVFASTNQYAGKTSIIAGIAKSTGEKFGYLKPLGDKLIYKKKRLWDYDSALIASLFNLEELPEDMSIGFDHSKLRYMYDRNMIKEKVIEFAKHSGKEKNLLLVEGGGDITYGKSVYLDAISIAKYLEASFVLVTSGSDNVILDNLAHFEGYIKALKEEVDFTGVIINKIQDVDDFKQSHFDIISKMGIRVLGIVPYRQELTYITAGYVAEKLFAKVVAGEGGLGKIIKTVLVGAMSVPNAMKHPAFKEEKKMIITSGDRSDMILAAIETNSSCVVITNDILPPANIISKASQHNIPLLAVPWETFYTAKQIDDMEKLLTKEDNEKLEILSDLSKKYLDLSAIIK